MNDMTIGDFLEALRSEFPEFDDALVAANLPDFIDTHTEVSVQEHPDDEPDLRYRAVATCSYPIVGDLTAKFVIKVYTNGKLSLE